MANEKESGEKKVESMTLDEQVEDLRRQVEEEAEAERQAAAAEESEDEPGEAEEGAGKKDEPSDAAGESDEGAGTVEDAADDGQEGEKVYKSQGEVDRAFGKRIKAERRKWEKEQEEAREKERAKSESHGVLTDRIRKAFPGLSDEEILEELDDRSLEQAAEESGLTADQIKAMDKRYGGTERKKHEKESAPALPEDVQANIQRIQAEAEELNKVYPFDLAAMTGNKKFAGMVLSGAPVAEALRLTDPDFAKLCEEKFREKTEAEYAEKLKKRNDSLPPSKGKGKGGNADLDVRKMTDEELEAIAERVRRGERVVI